MSLRPKNLKEFIGQQEVKKNLNILIEAAKKRGEPCDHILFYGPPGLGKTSLAKIVANEMGSAFYSTSGPALQKPGDLAAIITSLKFKDILFIDEIHRLNKMVEELLYPALEDFHLDVVLGKGPSAQILKINFYSINDIVEILKNDSISLNIVITEKALKEIALRSRFTPRIAQRLLRRVRDFAQIHNKTLIDKKDVLETFAVLGIDRWGLEKTDRQFLRLLDDKFNGGPVGIETIAKAFGEDQRTIEDLYEPYLMRMGFLRRTKNGRVLTNKYLQIKRYLK